MSHDMIEKVHKRIGELTMLSIFPEEPIHSVNTLEWVLKLNPDADMAVRTAALGHDIERSFEDKRIHSEDYDNYDEYKQAHALNSGQIIAQILEQFHIDQETVHDVARLVAHHEMGGDEREELVKNADILSFFHVCLPFYYDRKGDDITRKRAVWSYKRLPEDLREYISDFGYMDPELKSLVHDSLGLDDGELTS